MTVTSDDRADANGAAGSPRTEPARRLALLRTELRRQGLDGFVVPRADEHQGEYVAPRSERLAWITGFTGSAGLAVILAEKAAVFVDGRYTLQVRAEVEPSLFEIRHLIDDPHAEWCAANLAEGAQLGYDPWLHTVAWVERTGPVLERAGIRLVPVAANPVDAVWADQPPPPSAPVVPHDMAYAGKPSAEKRAELASALAEDGVAAAVLTAPDSIAWLLNIRGADVPHAPLPLSFALLRADGQVDLFIDRRKLSPGLEGHLGNQVALAPPEAIGPALDALGAAGQVVQVDPQGTAAWVFQRLSAAGAAVRRQPDPTALPRACKNETEIAGARAAHSRDGAALVRFFAWLAEEVPFGRLTELGVADRLRQFRSADPLFRDVSFPTIAGAGPNGAIVHYRPGPATDRRLESGSLLLLDSGAQYLDGTTDVTRTTVIGRPTPEMRDRFTLVLKGHIALATARFPRGTTGSQLDVLARQYLWRRGLDYDHGTGHGVGSYLSVHEGPARIAKQPSMVPLAPGMILSNEPGYYRADAYGIRIENLLLVQPLELADAERPMLGFETLTLCPIDLDLVDPAMLTRGETEWLNAYHARVRDSLAPLLPGPDRGWLETATRPLPIAPAGD